MKYRIDSPAYEGAPQVWDVVRIEDDFVVCRIFTKEEDAEMIRDLYEARVSQ